MDATVSPLTQEVKITHKSTGDLGSPLALAGEGR